MSLQQGQTQGMGMGQPPGMGGQQRQPTGGVTTQLQSVTVEDVIQTDVVTAEPDTPITELTNMMEEEDVGSVVIVEDDSPVSIVTDRKIALSLSEMDDPSESTAEDVMSGDIITGKAVLTVFEALDKMSDENIRRLPIVDDDESLEGIVTLDDILALLGTEMQNATDIIKAQSPRM